MKNFSLKKIIAVLIIPAIALFINSSYADQANATPPIGGGGADNLIGGYGANFLTPPQNAPNSNFYLFTQSPSWTDTITTNLFFNNYLQSASSTQLSPATLTTSALNSLLTATTANASDALTAAMTQFFPLSDPTALYNFANGQANGTSNNNPASNNPFANKGNASAPTSSVNSLNLDALITPVQYDTTTYNTDVNAANFIKYISNQYNPTALIDFTKIISTNNLTQALGTQAAQQYLYILRKMLAGYSVGMSDMYYLYNQRVPQDTTALLGNQFNSITQSTLPQALQKQASPLAIQEWMATHRLTSYDPNTKTPPWVTSMENATPATLQRETVYLLAEIRYEMFQQRMLQERILATLAAQELQNLGSQQIQLQQAETAVCSNSLFSNNNACPPAPTSSSSGSVASSPTPTSSSSSSSSQ